MSTIIAFVQGIFGAVTITASIACGCLLVHYLVQRSWWFVLTTMFTVVGSFIWFILLTAPSGGPDSRVSITGTVANYTPHRGGLHIELEGYSNIFIIHGYKSSSSYFDFNGFTQDVYPGSTITLLVSRSFITEGREYRTVIGLSTDSRAYIDIQKKDDEARTVEQTILSIATISTIFAPITAYLGLRDYRRQVKLFVSYNLSGVYRAGSVGIQIFAVIFMVLFGFFAFLSWSQGSIRYSILFLCFVAIGVILFAMLGTVEVSTIAITYSAPIGRYRVYWDDITRVEVVASGTTIQHFIFYGDKKCLPLSSAHFWTGPQKLQLHRFIQEEIKRRSIPVKEIERVPFIMPKNTRV